MAIKYKVKDEKVRYDINGEAAKMSAFSWGKINKYAYLVGLELLPSDQSRIIELAKFTYSDLVKHLKNK